MKDASPPSPTPPVSYQQEYENVDQAKKAVEPTKKDIESYGRDPPKLHQENDYELSKGTTKPPMIEVEPSPMGADFDKNMITRKENNDEDENSNQEVFGEPSLPSVKKEQDYSAGAVSSEKKITPIAIRLPEKMNDEETQEISGLRIAEETVNWK